MTSRDYTKEIGVRNEANKVPLPYAVAIIAGVLAAGGFGLAAMHPGGAKEPEVKEAKATVATAQSAVVKK